VTAVSQGAYWLALVAAAFNTGMALSRWRLEGGAEGATRVQESAWFVAAALALVGTGTLAGDLLRDLDLPILASTIPIQATAGQRLAALWSVPALAALSLATVCLLLAALAAAFTRGLPWGSAPRVAGVLSGTAAVFLAVGVLDTPRGLPAMTVPPFVQSLSASLAAAAALTAVVLIVHAAALGAALRGEVADRAVSQWRLVTLAAFLLATVALGAEQLARASLGIDPGVPVVAGSASSGLVLWVIAGTLLHRRVRALFLAGAEPARTPPRIWAARLAHVGAAALILSFGAHVFAARTTLDLPPGEAVVVDDAFGRSWRLVNQGVSRFDTRGADVTAIAIEATGPDARTRLVASERRDYHSASGSAIEPVRRRGSFGTPAQQVRILLESADAGERARVRVAFVPLLVLWPAGIALLVGSILALLLTPMAPRDTSFSPS
jgi:hypothetical protein